MKILELFGGIGACSKALDKLGIEYEIADYVEIDKYAVKSFNAIHNTNFEPQDITQWNKDIEVDLIMHGSPCQDFSSVGTQAGGDEGSGTRSSLMYETLRIVEKLKPKYVIWENVRNMLSAKHKHNFDNYINKMNELGYTSCFQVLNAKDYGIPQNRERVFTVSIRNDINKNFTFPEKQELKLKLKDMLEENVEEKYYLSSKMINYISSTGTANYKNADCKINLEVARPITTIPNKRAGTTNYISESLPENYDLKGLHKTLRETLETNVIQEGVNYIDAYNRKIDNSGLAKTILTRVDASNHTYIAIKDKDVKIRKLTCKETWRLMGFEDQDIEKAQKVNSNAQLYKQAGNSIVVNVLEAILKKLLMNDEPLKGQTTIFDFTGE